MSGGGARLVHRKTHHRIREAAQTHASHLGYVGGGHIHASWLLKHLGTWARVRCQARGITHPRQQDAQHVHNTHNMPARCPTRAQHAQHVHNMPADNDGRHTRKADRLPLATLWLSSRRTSPMVTHQCSVATSPGAGVGPVVALVTRATTWHTVS